MQNAGQHWTLEDGRDDKQYKKPQKGFWLLLASNKNSSDFEDSRGEPLEKDAMFELEYALD